jgi:peroxiredoxin
MRVAQAQKTLAAAGTLLVIFALGGQSQPLLLAQNEKGADAKPPLAPLKKLTVRVLDAEGNPVAGAHVGLAAHFGPADEPKKPADTDADGFVYERHRFTNSQGIAEIEAGGADIRALLEDQAIVSREEKRHLVAIAYPDPAKVKEKLDVTLAPECRIAGRVMSAELKKDKKPLGSTTVSLGDGDHVALTCTSDATGDYHFFVPAGQYLLDAIGSNIFRVFAVVSVASNERDLVFEPMLAKPSKLALLEGQPAPDLRGVAAWKNGPAPTLSSLKGKCVVLFFFRASAPESLASVPAIVDLYEKLKKHGLVVIGVEVDVDRDRKPIDSVQKLDDMLAKPRKEAWSGRDIPFPVAIVSPSFTPLGEQFPAREFSDSSVSADYGVTEYPTVLLIDRHGVLVSELDDSDQSLALLEKTLGLRLFPTPRKPAKPEAPPPPTRNPARAK